MVALFIKTEKAWVGRDIQQQQQKFNLDMVKSSYLWDIEMQLPYRKRVVRVYNSGVNSAINKLKK